MHTRFMLLTSSALVAMSLLGGCGSSSPTGPSIPPVVTSVNGATMPAGPIGSTVVILGLNFGSNQAVAGGQVLFSNGIGGTVAATITSGSDWTDNIIVTTVPAGSASGSLVVKTVAGSSVPITFTITQQAAFRPSTVSWTVTNALPLGLSGHALATATFPITTTQSKSFFYVLGGADSTNVPRATVLHTTVSGSGGVSGWSATTALPAPVAFATAVTATPFNSRVTGAGYIYVLGGDSTASGKPVATVYKGTLDSSGAVTVWSATTTLPVALHSLGAVVFNGNVYIAGGSGAGNVPVAGVYRAVIGSNGDLGAWQALASLPFKRSYFGFGLNGLFLYALGGDSGTVTPNDSSLSATALSDVVYAQLDVRTGNLTAAGWTLGSNKLKKVVSKHTAVVAGGNVLVTAGLYTGATTGSTEESYAVLNPDGSTGAFNGATGANTIASVGGGNIFNHAAVGYVDGGGVFHVLVVGGDDVNTPTKKHTGVFYY